MNDNDYDDNTDYLALWIAVQGITLTGQCAFCSKYAELVTTTCDDLVCQQCYNEFESALNGDTDL